MNRKWYWVLRKKILNIIFKIKVLLLRGFEWASVKRQQRTLFSAVVKKAIIGLAEEKSFIYL